VIAFFLAFLVCAALTAGEAAYYVSNRSPVVLASAIFCGMLALFNLVMAARA